jgi:hypothetical protein
LDGLDRGKKVLKLFEENIDDVDKLQLDINNVTAILQFEDYLYGDSEIILDQHVIPVLIAISKYPSKTFGDPIPYLSIIVLEGNSEDIIISPPSGGFEKDKGLSMI